MKTMEANLWKEMNELNKMVEEAEKRLKAAPKGLVRIKKKRGKAEYYYKDENAGGGNGRYLRKNERDIRVYKKIRFFRTTKNGRMGKFN